MTEQEKTAAALRILEAYRAWIELVDGERATDVRFVGLSEGSVLLTQSHELAERIRDALGVHATRLEVNR